MLNIDAFVVSSDKEEAIKRLKDCGIQNETKKNNNHKLLQQNFLSSFPHTAL